MMDLGTLGGVDGQSEAYAINNAGQVVGWSKALIEGSNISNRAFLWQGGVMTDLGSLGGTLGASWATDINDAGQVVGYAEAGTGETHAFLWQDGVMTDLGTLPSGTRSEAHAINEAGQVAGWSYNAAGQARAVRWTVTTPPTAPANLAGTTVPATPPTAIELTWTDASGSETEFVLDRREKPAGGRFGPWAEVARPGANTTAYTDDGLTTGSTYRYRIRACNAAGCSSWTVSGSIVVDVAPAAPTGALATQTSPTSTRITWTDASDNESWFAIHRRQRIDGAYGPWAEIYRRTADTEAYTDSGLTAGETYQHRVRACNGAGCSTFDVPPRVFMEPSAPVAPTDVTAAADGAGTIDVAWTDASSNEAAFEVWRRVMVDGVFDAWQRIATTAAGATGYSDPGRDPTTTYQYRVRACNGAGCSTYDVSPHVTTPAS